MEAHEEFFSPQFPSDTTTTTNINNATAAAADQFIVEDLFDFSNDDATFDDSLPANSTEGSPPPLDSTTTTTTTTTTNSNFLHDISPRNSADGNFSGDLSVPYDELAELEWLSKFAEESFSSEDLQKMQLISGMKVPNDAASQTHDEPTGPLFSPPVSVPAKARSKRSRGPPCNWTSRLLVLSPSTTPTSSSASDSDTTAAPALVPAAVKKPAALRKRDADVGDGRRCLHCATDKTPQWRTGPMGPKTLCNACGVRYKSGRLVPEYRPAASPTFMLTKHSNSHRKVLELRRQKEMMKAHQQQLLQMQHHQSMMFDASSNGDDYLIHQHVAGPDFSHLI